MLYVFAGSSNGRIAVSETVHLGSNPSPAANMNEKVEAKDILPSVPEVTEEQLEKARKSGRYESIAFEEYKFIAQLVAIVARIDKSSDGFKKIPNQQYHVLMGLMNRCARLILGTMQLSHKGKFGESTAIILRCIFETGVKIIWLCSSASTDNFNLYVNDSLKPEIELKDTIIKNISERGGDATKLEKRMLDSIEYHIKSGETSEDSVRSSKKMLDMATLIERIGFNRLVYLVNHRLGSHHVHGTWPSLIFHYLESDANGFVARGNDVSTKANELLMVTLIMSKSLHEYCNYVLLSPTKEVLMDLCLAEEKTVSMIVDDMSKHGW